MYSRFRFKEKGKEPPLFKKEDVYIRFPVLKADLKRLQKMWVRTPPYEIAGASSEDQEARELLQIYNEIRLEAFLKTHKTFQVKYPQSRHKEFLDHLDVVAHSRLSSKNEEYFKTLRPLAIQFEKRYPRSQFQKRNEFVVSVAYLEKGQALEAARGFLKILSQVLSLSQASEVKLFLAESYLQLNKLSEARRIYRELGKKYEGKAWKSEVSYRVGDVYFQAREFKRAVQLYRSAFQKYPEEAGKFPNAYYNMAESLFWLGQFEESLQAHVHFIEKFPSHTYGGYVLTRVGELLGILGAPRSQVMGALEESFFRFSKHPGGEVARLRILNEKIHRVKSSKEVNRLFSDMEERARRSNLPKASELVDLLKSESFHERGEYERAWSHLVKKLKSYPGNIKTSVFRKRILESMSRQIEQLLEQDKVDELFRIYSKYSNTWLREGGRVDLVYLLARAFERMGWVDEALESYERVLSSLEGSSKSPERLLSKEQVFQARLSLGVLYMRKNRFEGAVSQFGALEEGPWILEESEQARWLARFYEFIGFAEKAQSILTSFTKVDTSPSRLSLLWYLAQLQLESGELEKVQDTLSQIEEGFVESIEMRDELVQKILALRVELWLKESDTSVNFDIYSGFLEKWARQGKASELRYRVGKVLFERGDFSGAQKVWALFTEKEEKLYSRLIKEDWEHKKWMESYQQYMKPMAGLYRNKGTTWN